MVIPENWIKVTLGNLVDIRSGLSPSAYTLLKNGKYPFVKVEDLNCSRKYQEYSRVYTDDENNIIPKGATIFPKRGAAIMNNKVRITNCELCIDTNMMAIWPKNEMVTSGFLYLIVESEKLYKIADISTIPQINNKHITPYRVSLPLLSEQREIEKVLSTWDRAIEKTEALIAAKERRKKWLMQQLLTGGVRFGEFVKSAGKRKTSYYDLPEDWGYPTIGEVAKQVSVKNTSGAALPVLSCTKHAGLVDSLAYFGKQIFSEDLSTYKVVPKGAFAYATNHIEEGSIGFQGLYKEAVISPMYTVFKTTKAVHDGFLFKLLKTEWYRHIFEVCTSASVDRRGSLRWKEFAKIRIPLPGMPEQVKISAVLDVADGEIQQLKTKLFTLKEQKKGLMQQLLTGKVRVKGG